MADYVKNGKLPNVTDNKGSELSTSHGVSDISKEKFKPPHMGSPGHNDRGKKGIDAAARSRQFSMRDTLAKAEKQKQDATARQMDFFTLVDNPHVTSQKNDDPMRDYYSQLLGKKRWMARLGGGLARQDQPLSPVKTAPAKKQSTTGLKGKSRVQSVAESERSNGQSGNGKTAESGTFVIATLTSTRTACESHLREIDANQKSIAMEFQEATTLYPTGERVTLFETVFKRAELIDLRRSQQQPEKVFLSPTSKRNQPFRSTFQNPEGLAVGAGDSLVLSDILTPDLGTTARSKSQYPWKQEATRSSINSGQVLLESWDLKSPEKKDAIISRVYLPQARRELRAMRQPPKKGGVIPWRVPSERQGQLAPLAVLQRRPTKDFKIMAEGDVLWQASEKDKTAEASSSIAGQQSSKTGTKVKQTSFHIRPLDLDKAGSQYKEDNMPTKTGASSATRQALNTNTNRKRQDILARKQSFSLTQTKFGDAVNLWNPLKDKKNKTFINLKTIENMRAAKRYPLPAKLLHMPDDFELAVDSIMHAAYNQSDGELSQGSKGPSVLAPCNSQESNEEIGFNSSSASSMLDLEDQDDQSAQSDEELVIQKTSASVRVSRDFEIPTRKKRRLQQEHDKFVEQVDMFPDTKEGRKRVEALESIKIYREVFGLNPFNLDVLKRYPVGMAGLDMPLFVLKEVRKSFLEVAEDLRVQISQELAEKKLLPTLDHFQVLYDHYCSELKCTSISLGSYFRGGILQLVNYPLSDNQAKALACILPVLDGLVEIHLDNNNLRDELTTLILMAAFISPTLSSIKLTSNAVKHHAASSLGTMMKLWPEKIKELAITRTPAGGDHLDKCFDSLQKYTGLQVLNLSGTSISIDVCRRIGGCLKSGKRLIRLNLSNCKLAQQGARYVIDGLLENEGLEYLDLSGTALSASSYEFSIKLAKVLTTHMQLVHLNLSETKLQREEVFFLGMMAKHFKVLVGLHLPISELSRYDRVFLRILMNSSVPPLVRRLDHNAQVVASTEEVPDSEGNRQHIASRDFVKGDFQYFLRNFQMVEDTCKLLEKELTSLFETGDVDQLFKPKEDRDAYDSDKPVPALLEAVFRINKFDQNMVRNRTETEKFHDTHVKLNDYALLYNFGAIGLTAESQQQKQEPASGARSSQGDEWLAQNALKVERMRLRVAQEATKDQGRNTSAEMALLYLGIDKIANEVLRSKAPARGSGLAPPGEGRFTRQLGCKDIDGGEFWKDCPQCWVCEGWSKQRIEFMDEDLDVLKQNLDRMGDLDSVVQKCLDPNHAHMIKAMSSKKVKEFFLKQGKGGGKGAATTKGVRAAGRGSISSTGSNLGLETEVRSEDLQEIEDQVNRIGTTVQGGPHRLGRASIVRQLPGNFRFVRDIRTQNSPQLRDSSEEVGSSSSPSPRDARVVEAGSPASRDFTYGRPLKPSQERHRSPTDGSQRGLPGRLFKERDSEPLEAATQIIERDGKFYRRSVKKVFHYGAKYELSEYESVHSSRSQSAASSEDGFQSETEAVLHQFKQNAARQPKTNKRMQDSLAKNQPLTANAFGRKQVFLCASFCDWVPLEMKSEFELGLERKHGEGLNSFIQQYMGQHEELPTSEHREENSIQFSSFLKPGKHFFYFIYDLKHVFLSPNHNIVRFSGTNVFLNTVEVQATLKAATAHIVRPKILAAPVISAKTTFIEAKETPLELAKMFKSDVKKTQLFAICKSEDALSSLLSVLQPHFGPLKDIYDKLGGNSRASPKLRLSQFLKFCAHSGAIEEQGLSSLSAKRIYSQCSRGSTLNGRNTEEAGLSRALFLEAIVRLAQARHIDVPGGLNKNTFKKTRPLTLPEAVETYISHGVLPGITLNGMKQKFQLNQE